MPKGRGSERWWCAVTFTEPLWHWIDQEIDRCTFVIVELLKALRTTIGCRLLIAWDHLLALRSQVVREYVDRMDVSEILCSRRISILRIGEPVSV